MPKIVWQVVKTLRPHPLAVGQARNFCTRRLSSVLDDRSDAPDVVADAATIASELVTNAVTAGSSAIELCLGLRTNAIYIEVADDAAGLVAPGNPRPTDPKGRGLLVVAALSREWGVSAADGTKQVWAEIALAGNSDASIGSGGRRDSVI